MRRVMAAVSGSAVALALLAAAPATAGPGDPAASPAPVSRVEGLAPPPRQATTPGQVLVRQQATLTTANRPSDLPRPGTPAGRRLTQAVIDIEVIGDTQFIDAHVDLETYPTGDPDALVSVQFGYASDEGCSAAPGADKWATTDSYSWSYHLFGQSPTAWGPKPAQPWNCAFAVVTSLDGATVYDAVVGALVNTYEAPRLRLGTARVLGKKQKKLRIAKGGWTPVEVEVSNSGTRDSGEVTISGKGKGLKVTRGSAGAVRAGATGSAVLRVKPRGKKKPKRLTLTARDGTGVTATRKIRVKRIAAPRRPVAGRYRNKSGTVRFTIRKGRITGFTVTTQTRCGGYGTVPQYTQNTYDFPKTRIPRNGIVTASAKGKASGVPWSTQLRARVAGGKVTRGLFSYFGPGGCSAAESFTATRSGR